MFSWHGRQGHCCPTGFPPRTSPSHSHIAAQSSLSFASRVLGWFFYFCRAMLQTQSLSRLGLKITLSGRQEGVAEAPHLVIFCCNSCQQIPQLMKGKWNSSSSKKPIPSLLLITSQHNSDKVTDSKYDAIISLQFISIYSFLHSHSIHTSFFLLLVSQICQELLIWLCNPLFFAVIKCFPPTQPKYLIFYFYRLFTELSSIPHRKSKIYNKPFLTTVVAFHQIKSKIRIATSNHTCFVPPARRGKGKEAA